MNMELAHFAHFWNVFLLLFCIFWFGVCIFWYFLYFVLLKFWVHMFLYFVFLRNCGRIYFVVILYMFVIILFFNRKIQNNYNNYTLYFCMFFWYFSSLSKNTLCIFPFLHRLHFVLLFFCSLGMLAKTKPQVHQYLLHVPCVGDFLPPQGFMFVMYFGVVCLLCYVFFLYFNDNRG